MPDVRPRWIWVVVYTCGCAEYGRRSSDLVNYCPRHGDSQNFRERYDRDAEDEDSCDAYERALEIVLAKESGTGKA